MEKFATVLCFNPIDTPPGGIPPVSVPSMRYCSITERDAIGIATALREDPETTFSRVTVHNEYGQKILDMVRKDGIWSVSEFNRQGRTGDTQGRNRG